MFAVNSQEVRKNVRTSDFGKLLRAVDCFAQRLRSSYWCPVWIDSRGQIGICLAWTNMLTTGRRAAFPVLLFIRGPDDPVSPLSCAGSRVHLAGGCSADTHSAAWLAEMGLHTVGCALPILMPSVQIGTRLLCTCRTTLSVRHRRKAMSEAQ